MPVPHYADWRKLLFTYVSNDMTTVLPQDSLNEESIFTIINTNPPLSIKSLMELGEFKDIGRVRSIVYDLEHRSLITSLTSSAPHNMGEIVYKSKTYKPATPVLPTIAAVKAKAMPVLDVIKSLEPPTNPVLSTPITATMPTPVLTPINATVPTTPKLNVVSAPQTSNPFKGLPVRALFLLCVLRKINEPIIRRNLVYAVREYIGNHQVVTVDSVTYSAFKVLEQRKYIKHVNTLALGKRIELAQSILEAVDTWALDTLRSATPDGAQLVEVIEEAVTQYHKTITGEVITHFNDTSNVRKRAIAASLNKITSELRADTQPPLVELVNPTPPTVIPTVNTVAQATSYIEGVNWQHVKTLDSTGAPLLSNWVYDRATQELTKFTFTTQATESLDQHIKLNDLGQAEVKAALALLV